MSENAHSGSGLLGDFRLLVYGFVALRLILLIVYQPQLIEVENGPAIERGLTVLGDFREHYDFARGITSDNLPYRDYWVEFPPVWIGLSALVALLTPDFSAWASLMFLVMLAFDVGNLVLIRRLDERLHGGIGLAWIYGLFAAPLVMSAWNFEVIVLFSILAGFNLWIDHGIDYPVSLEKSESGRDNMHVVRPAPADRVNPVPTIFMSLRRRIRAISSSPVIIAFGILTKYIPVLLLPTIWRFSNPQTALRYTVIVLALVLMILIPLVVWGGDMAIRSLTVQFDKPSYQTVWALIDGNYGTGSFPGGAVRYNTDLPRIGHDPVIPGWLRLIPFAALGFWIFRLSMRDDVQTQLAFLTVTVTLFMLWSQAWSPQWTVILMPLILLNFPSRAGVLVCLTLMLGAFIEYPLLFRYSTATNNLISGAYRSPFALLILMRTLLLAGISSVLVQKLRSS